MSKNRKRIREGRATATEPTMSRRAWIGTAVAAGAATVAGVAWWQTGRTGVLSTEGRVAMTVYSSPTCGCCHKWVDHLEQAGFVVTVESAADVTPHKRRLGVPDSLWSCHTGVVSGYAVEGHVPADLIRRLIREGAEVVGLAVPGMPNGSPGMEGLSKDRYEVLTFDRAGATQVYAVR